MSRMARIKLLSNNPKRKILLLFCLLGAVVAAYVSGIFYFREHFFLNTEVNGIRISGYTRDEARTRLESEADDFHLSVVIGGQPALSLSGSDLNLRFDTEREINRLLREQNPFVWPLNLLGSRNTRIDMEVYFEEESLHRQIASSDFYSSNQTPPVSATILIENYEAIVVPHQYGNTLDLERLEVRLQEAIVALESELHLAEEEVFLQPEFTSESPEVTHALEIANLHLSAEITLEAGENTFIDRELIADWILVDDELNVIFDEEAVGAWLDEFIETVNTHGTTRQLRTPNGRRVSVTGGYYGWIVDRELELEELLENIRSGKAVFREPIYSQRAESHDEQDWGNTFLQVSLTEQHMWAIVDGEVVFESPVVTGLPRDGRNTPEGVYFILEMLSPTVLIGVTDPETGEPIYETPVSYWMRTTWAGHGFHDATWQERFGGLHYRTNGSHGCTNLPLSAARELYGLIFINMPVVVHY